MLGLALASLTAIAQDNLDDLERRLDAAKKADVAKKESTRRALAARAANEASQGRLVLEADAPCEVRIDGERKATLKPGAISTVEVEGGQQLIDCVSTEFPDIKVREVREVTAGNKLVVSLTLAAQVELARTVAESRRAEAEVERARALAREAAAKRYVAVDDGVLRDTTTGLDWSRQDNGSDIDWNGARNLCASRGEGWRLPSVDELVGIHDGSDALSTACGTATCKVSASFRLTSYWFWSATENGSSEAWYVSLADGLRLSLDLSYRNNGRALCVRRP